jgi:hypothetical protein
MICIAISVEAYEALVATLPLGTVAYEPEPNAKDERLIWLDDIWLNKLDAMRKPGESYSDLILRLVELAELPSRQCGPAVVSKCTCPPNQHDGVLSGNFENSDVETASSAWSVSAGAIIPH